MFPRTLPDGGLIGVSCLSLQRLDAASRLKTPQIRVWVTTV